MYGLAVNLIMSVSGHPSIINEIINEFPNETIDYGSQCILDTT